MGVDYAFLLKTNDPNRFISEVCGEELVPCPFRGPNRAYSIRGDIGFDRKVHDASFNFYETGWVEVSCSMRFRSHLPDTVEITKSLCDILARHGTVYVGSDSMDWDDLCDDGTLSKYLTHGTITPYDPEAEIP